MRDENSLTHTLPPALRSSHSSRKSAAVAPGLFPLLASRDQDPRRRRVFAKCRTAMHRWTGQSAESKIPPRKFRICCDSILLCKRSRMISHVSCKKSVTADFVAARVESRKPLMPYTPNAFRSRLAAGFSERGQRFPASFGRSGRKVDDAPVPYKNASTIEFNDGIHTCHKRRLNQIITNIFRRSTQSFQPSINKWIVTRKK